MEDDHRLLYRMNRPNRGTFIIIDNVQFKDRRWKERVGSEVDATTLTNTLKSLGFTVEYHLNKTRDEMVHIMTEAASRDHTYSDCFGCAVLTHGDKSHLFGTDDILKSEKFFEPFSKQRCRSLIGKPKLFFLQACRGEELDRGATTHDVTDATDTTSYVRVPKEADCLYAYSTAAGFRAFRNQRDGSVFIQTLCKMLDKWGAEREIIAILTRVNYIVAYEFESKSKDLCYKGKKQVPSFVSQLTKRLYFPPKT